jgi:serine/threonine protein kinase
MTPFRHSCGTLYELRQGQQVHIGDRPYIVKKRSRGGMGFILFLELDAANAPETFSVHGLRVALKSILPTAVDDEAAALFRRELVVWSGLQCGNIVGLNEILDAGHDGWVAAMNWHLGSLRDHISSKSQISLPDAIRVVHDVLNGVAYAYEKDRVIHLDLKPENILYEIDMDRMTATYEVESPSDFEIDRMMHNVHYNRFMVGDWGIASIKQPQLNAIAGMPPSDEACRKTFNNMGTILYMAPERFVRGYRSSLASDIFSLGMIFLELVTGKLPHGTSCPPVESLFSLSYLTEAAALLENVDVPAKTRRLILSMIAPDPSERPASYPDLRKSLISVFQKTDGFFSGFFNPKLFYGII